MTRKKPTWPQARIIKASHVISSTQKLIWLEHHAMWNDREGAYISARNLGFRVGLGRATVERARQVFLHWGLIQRSEAKNGGTVSWYTQLPARCQTKKIRLNDDDLEHYVELLDAHITSRIGDGGQSKKNALHGVLPSPHEGGFPYEPSREDARTDMWQMSEVLPHGMSEVSALHEVSTDGEDGEDGHTGTTAYPGKKKETGFK